MPCNAAAMGVNIEPSVKLFNIQDPYLHLLLHLSANWASARLPLVPLRTTTTTTPASLHPSCHGRGMLIKIRPLQKAGMHTHTRTAVHACMQNNMKEDTGCILYLLEERGTISCEHVGTQAQTKSDTHTHNLKPCQQICFYVSSADYKSVV